MAGPSYAAFDAAKPYFDLVRGALGDFADGEHFFDIMADDVVYEVRYDFPGWPRILTGRTALMEQFKGYGNHISLRSADALIVHAAGHGHTMTIEYEVHGNILGTGADYTNRFASIITLRDRKISHWRDYMDSLAAWNALTPTRQ